MSSCPCNAKGPSRTSFAAWLQLLDVPFTCDACGAGRDLTQIPAHGAVLRCPQCEDERPFFRPPLLIVAGTSGAGKSTICARLAGTIPGAVLLDADVFTDDMISLVHPNEDYPAFWRLLARLAHEISQNNLTVVFFSVMLPQQLLANTDVLDYFESVSFLCLRCEAEVLRTRFIRRLGSGSDMQSIRGGYGPVESVQRCSHGRRSATDHAHVIDATRSIGEVEGDVRGWILDRLQRCVVTWSTSGAGHVPTQTRGDQPFPSSLIFTRLTLEPRATAPARLPPDCRLRRDLGKWVA